jgi:thiol-disulfide isomerase/thioredoxin
MKRRDIVAGAGGLAGLAALGWYGIGPGGDPEGFPGHVAGGPRTRDRDGSSRPRIDPVPVETIEAPHSSDGRMRVPVPHTVTVIDLFATWCAGCRDQLRNLARAHRAVGDDVQFVSVTNQAIGGGFTRDNLRSFWRETAGRWPVGFDDQGALTTRLGARGLPHTAVTDPAGRVVFAEQGITGSGTVVEAVDEAQQ